MPKTLLLRFASIDQSWGIGSFGRRLTARIPTRSGVEGHLAATLGAPRGQWPQWLSALEIMVRVDAPGRIHHDFHTVNAPHESVIRTRTRQNALGALKPNGVPISTTVADYTVPNGDAKAWKIKGVAPTLVSTRDYLIGAEFLVAIGGPEEHVAAIAESTRHPVFMPYLGRKSCSPEFPYFLGVREGTPETILTALPTVAGVPGAALNLHRITSAENPVTARVLPSHAADFSEWKTA